jgi:uncharacterized protein (TIGR02271 family)
LPAENNKVINWNEVLEKEAVGVDGLDLGTVKEVGDTFIITQKGLINKKKYHLPLSSVDGFNNGVLILKINEADLHSYQQTSEGDNTAFEGYSSFKASDMSKDLETTIPLLSEELEVSKKVIEDNINIIKEPKKETKTAQIELMHEKVTIEKRPVGRSDDDDDDYESKPTDIYSTRQESLTKDSKTEIAIPIKREEPVITKRSFVREEVIVKKKPVSETKTITEEITNEEIRYDNRDMGESKEKVPI